MVNTKAISMDRTAFGFANPIVSVVCVMVRKSVAVTMAPGEYTAPLDSLCPAWHVVVPVVVIGVTIMDGKRKRRHPALHLQRLYI